MEKKNSSQPSNFISCNLHVSLMSYNELERRYIWYSFVARYPLILYNKLFSLKKSIDHFISADVVVRAVQWIIYNTLEQDLFSEAKSGSA